MSNRPDGGSLPEPTASLDSVDEVLRRVVTAHREEQSALETLLQEHQHQLQLIEHNFELVRELVQVPTPIAEADTGEERRQQEIRCSLLQAENQELADDVQRLTEENNNLFKLYIASHRLHATLAIGEVLDVISEIVLNVIGADRYAILFHDDASRSLSPVLVRGIDREMVGSTPHGDHVIWQAIESKRNYLLTENPRQDAQLDRPLVVIPLRIKNQTLGAIVLYRLLSHKPTLRSVDYALFDYLATHAAMAIHSAKLYTESEKKVSKMKEFLSLMQATPDTAPGDGSAG
jgi:hypothetical protein